jgi:excisionase family DNA binding protein
VSDLVGTPAQVAEALETSYDSVLYLKEECRLPFVMINRQSWVVPWFALKEWLASEVAKNGFHATSPVEEAVVGTGQAPDPRGEVAGVATYSVAAAAALLGMSKATLYRAIKRGDISAIRFGRAIQIPRYAIDYLLEGAR